MSDLDVHLDAIAAGDPRAFALWVAGAEPRVRLSLSSFASVVDVEAVVQETLLRIWQVAPRIERDGKGDSTVRFAVRVARNLAIDETRRRRLQPVDAEALALIIQAEAPPPPVVDPMLRRTIEACRDALPRQPAAVLQARLNCDGGQPDRDLAAGLGMRLNTFLKNFGRARALLAACLKKRGVSLEVGL